MTSSEWTSQADQVEADEGRSDARRITRLVGALIIVALLVAFVLDNSQSVKVGFVFFSSTVPLIWVLLITILLGMLADRLLIWRRRQSRRAKEQEQAQAGPLP